SSRLTNERTWEELIVRKPIDIGNIAFSGPAEFDPERVDQHEAPDPLDAADAHFECDPATERRTDERDIVEALAVEQIKIEISEIVDGPKLVWPLGVAKARVSRCRDTPTLRQPVDEFAVLREIVAAVQKQQRRAVSGCQHRERDVADLDALHFRPSLPPVELPSEFRWGLS